MRGASWAVLAALFILPLYPKLGLVAVPGTYIPIRLDDLLVAVVALVWLASLVVQRRPPAVPRLLTGAAIAWEVAALVGLAAGVLLMHSISPITGFAYWAKPVEYLVLGAIVYDLVRTGALSLPRVLAVVLTAAGIVVVYAMLERLGLAPHLPGVTPPEGTVTSTFGDLHELAGYLGIVILLVVTLQSQLVSPRARAVGLIVIAAGAVVMYFTAVRTEYLVLGICLLALLRWRPARVPTVVGASVMAALFVVPLVAALASGGFGGHPVKSHVPAASASTAPDDPLTTNVTSRFTDVTFAYSWIERFTQKWPKLFAAGMTSPIVGLGPSAATEAADGYYLRVFVEAGVIGLACFLALIGAIAISLRRAIRSTQGLAHNVAVGMLAATVFVALVGTVIDVWVASRVMELYWPMLGASLAAASLRSA